MADAVERGADAFDRWFVPIALGILLVAAALRLPELALNPFHHDEGVNGYFTTNLARTGIYTYDPENYHGPSLYYFALISEVLLGLTTEAMRLVPALFGIGLVALVLALRPYLGSLAVLVAAALLTVSPGAVYVARYFIHETLVVAFSLGLVVAVIYYLDRRSLRYLLAAAATAALLFTTKESALITVLVLLIAVWVANVYLRLRSADGPPHGGDRGKAGRRGSTSPAPSVWIDGVEYRPAKKADRASEVGPPWLSIPGEHLAGAALLFLVIYVLLFTSFFTNFKGLSDSITAYFIWFQRGDATQIQPIYKYLEWMIPLDLPILALGTVGGVIAAIRMPSRLWVVIGLWALGITAALSIPQYKTPWIILNMLVPLALLAGLAVSELWRSRRLRLVAPVAFGVAFLFSGFFAIDLNFNRYDNEAYPYVYVHSTRSMLELVEEVEATAARAGTGLDTGIVIMAPEYWPLPWYFRDYPKAGFYGVITDVREAMIIANVNQEAELTPSLQADYDRVGTWNLRPGVDLVLFVRRDVPKA